MKYIYIDAADEGFAVRILSGMKGDKTTKFATHAEAEAFALSKMGRSGMICDNTKVKK